MFESVKFPLCPAAAVGPGSAFKLVETLAALGRAREALTVLRAQRSEGGAPREPDQALRKARVGLQIRLSCNLLTDAFMEVGLPPGSKVHRFLHLPDSTRWRV